MSYSLCNFLDYFGEESTDIASKNKQENIHMNSTPGTHLSHIIDFNDTKHTDTHTQNPMMQSSFAYDFMLFIQMGNIKHDITWG